MVSLSGKISIEDEKAPVIIVDKMTEFTLDEPTSTRAAEPVYTLSHIYADEPSKPNPVLQKPNAEKRLWLNISDMDDADVEELLETLSYYPGETAVCFVKNGRKMGCSEKVNPNKALLAELHTFLPENCIKLV